MAHANDSEPETKAVRPKKWFLLFVAMALVAAAAAALSAYLLIDIMEKKEEAKNPFFRVVELTDDTEDPALWGKNFPQQYDLYRRTVDMKRTRYGGSEAWPRTPTEADPRSIVAQEKLDQEPRLKIIWAGYAFAKDFREDRGHAYMLEDQMYTQRQMAAKQPGACLNCHASVYVAQKKLGAGDLFRGFDIMNPLPYAEARKLVKHPVSCIDCHDPQTMQLRITRPAFIEGLRGYKASQGLVNYEVNTMASRQEMRSYVCAQCHVEYYFKGPEKRLTFPWAKGVKVEQILEYYDEAQFKDWTHALTGASTLKAQHPEFEMWSQGIHARSGVACADCHMPYKRLGAMKISDHHVQSPLLSINNACQTCHRVPEEELKDRAEKIQRKFFHLRNLALDAVVALIQDLQATKEKDAANAGIAKALELQRAAQFRLDFAEAENSTGFHAPQEAMRILGEAIDLARMGQIALRDPRYQPQSVAEQTREPVEEKK